MLNLEIARLFEQYANRLEFTGANPFRVRAYRTAASTIESATVSLAELATAPDRSPEELAGIGKDLAAKIREIVQTGTFTQLEELRAEIPNGVMEMLRIPGLGPKKAAVLFQELGIRGLDELKTALEAGKVASLKGFGKKSEQAIIQGLADLQTTEQRHLLANILPVAEEIADSLRQLPGVSQAAVAGSARRSRDTVGDLDVLVTASDTNAVMDALAAHPQVAAVLLRGETKQRVRLHAGIELDLRVVPAESYGAALQYFTGSKEHNITFRKRAVDRGLKVNEYGVFRDDVRIAGATEEEVYAAIDLPWITPELRENRSEFTWADAGQLPKLIEPGDLRGDLHMHTTATDGAGTVREMIAEAQRRGFEYISITDHSQRVSIARGLDAQRLRAHWQQIREVRSEFTGIHVLCGIECDILEDGTLDLSDDVLAEAEWVIAVLHFGLKQTQEQIMGRLLHAARHPSVCLIGHPTARLLLQRPAVAWDRDEFLRVVAEHGKLLEINAHPSRLDLDDVSAAAARELGIRFCINSDSHSTAGFDVLPWGIRQARRAGLETRHVVNTLPWSEFRKFTRYQN